MVVDHLSRFVAVLAEALDDHDLDADAIAARLFVSRFHLDRIVSSVAGEPPYAFRRRILLERSAFRLLTTTESILTIGVEAGYSSHEAYSRAFARAYGQSPAAFRRRPGAISLPAPSGVHFHPPGSLRLPAQKKVTVMDLLTSMVRHHLWLTGEILERATRLTDAQLDEPIELGVDDDPDPTTLRRLLSRLIGQLGMWNTALANEAYDWSVETHESTDSMRIRLAEHGPRFLAHVVEACDHEGLDDTFVNAQGTTPEVYTYGGMIAHVITFAAHRRTLAVLALDKHGITDLGWGDPMRWVADPVG